MQYILEGILYGLTLSILLGPIFIALTQSAIDRGYQAGIAVGVGIWFSDFLFITITYQFIQNISQAVNGEAFQLTSGILGGIILIGFGAYSFLKKPGLSGPQDMKGIKTYFQFFVKGFLVNTVNPFTFVFWISVISTYILARNITPVESFQFLSSILFVIILTDSLKVFLAHILRKFLTNHHILWINRIAGGALAVFGILLIIWSV